MTGMRNENIENKAAKAIKNMRMLFLWIGIAAVFNVGVFVFMGRASAIDFLGGYLIELSLSIDNVFVFLMIFMSFGIKETAQHRVLAWGIIGAVILRFIFMFSH